MRESELDLDKTFDICLAAEMSQVQIKAVDDLNSAGVIVHQVKETGKGKTPMNSAKQLRHPCRFCGRRHDGKREACPTWGKKCNRCGKDNHSAQKCGLNSNSNQVSMSEEEEEYPIFQKFFNDEYMSLIRVSPAPRLWQMIVWLLVLERPMRKLSAITLGTLLFVAFLQRCSKRRVKLAVEKLQLCLEEVPLIGHYATQSGLKVHPDKVRAILEMPRPLMLRAYFASMGQFST